jgi:hypothetical protein
MLDALDGHIPDGRVHLFQKTLRTGREYANGTIHVNNCECISNLYQLWIRKLIGVNKYNLETYPKTFQQFIDNNKRATKTREERFMEILYN